MVLYSATLVAQKGHVKSEWILLYVDFSTAMTMIISTEENPTLIERFYEFFAMHNSIDITAHYMPLNSLEHCIFITTMIIYDMAGIQTQYLFLATGAAPPDKQHCI